MSSTNLFVEIDVVACLNRVSISMNQRSEKVGDHMIALKHFSSSIHVAAQNIENPCDLFAV